MFDIYFGKDCIFTNIIMLKISSQELIDVYVITFVFPVYDCIIGIFQLLM